MRLNEEQKYQRSCSVQRLWGFGIARVEKISGHLTYVYVECKLKRYRNEAEKKYMCFEEKWPNIPLFCQIKPNCRSKIIEIEAC